MSFANDVLEIAALADGERRDWFVWDCLAKAAYEWSGYDRQTAIDLLRRAIGELSERDDSRLPPPTA